MIKEKKKFIESETIEYKNNYSSTTSRHTLVSICAFLNTGGGHVYVGIVESVQKVVGVNNIYSVVNDIKKDLSKITPYANKYVTVSTTEEYGLPVIDINVGKSNTIHKLKGDERYFVRIGDTNRLMSFDDVEYIKNKFPAVEKYEPHDTTKKNDFNNIIKDKNTNFYKVGNLKGTVNTFYKYMDLETAFICIKNGSLRFVEPNFWEDKCESWYYNADYSNIPNGVVNSPFLYACCLTYKRDNEAAWKIYSYNKMGLGARCVEFTLNRYKLREQLALNLKGCSVYIGNVAYISEYEFNNLDKKDYVKENGDKEPNEQHERFFGNYCLYKYINLMLTKREAFQHENEVRYFIIPQDASTRKKSYIENDPDLMKGSCLHKESIPNDVKIDWLEVLEEIRIDKKCSDFEKNLFQDFINDKIREKYASDITKCEEMLKKLTLKSHDVYGDYKQIVIEK